MSCLRDTLIFFPYHWRSVTTVVSPCSLRPRGPCDKIALDLIASLGKFNVPASPALKQAAKKLNSMGIVEAIDASLLDDTDINSIAA